MSFPISAAIFAIATSMTARNTAVPSAQQITSLTKIYLLWVVEVLWLLDEIYIWVPIPQSPAIRQSNTWNPFRLSPVYYVKAIDVIELKR